MTRQKILALYVGVAMLLAASGAAHATLLAHYNFDDWATPGVATDTGGLMNNAVIVNATYTGAGGGFTGSAGNRAIVFDAAGEVVQAPAAALQTMSTNNSASVSLWIFGDASQPRNDTIFSFTQSGTRQFQSHLPWGNSNIYFDTGGCCGSNTRINASTAASNFRGQWNHYVFVKDGNNKWIWQNGNLFLQQLGGATAPINAFNEAVIGAERNSAANNYRGLVDDFGIWDVGLTQAEARSIYTIPAILGLDYGIDDIVDVWNIHAAGAGSEGIVGGTYWAYTGTLPGSPNPGDAYTVGGWAYVALGDGTTGVSNIPEPATVSLLALGGLALLRRRGR